MALPTGVRKPSKIGRITTTDIALGTTCADHTPCPERYEPWADWADEMSRTHDQFRCGECGLWTIWRVRR